MTKKPLVLVADDDFTVRLLATEALEQAGFDVREAENGEEALEIFEQDSPEIVLLDVKMPKMDGFGACKKLRERPDGANVPILMITGVDELDSIQMAYDLGATDFMNKPINWLILTQRVRYMLRASRNVERLRKSEAGLAAAQKIARMGNWELNLPENIFRCSGEICRIYGYDSPDGVQSFGDLYSAVHEDDREEAEKLFEQAKNRGIPFRTDHRILLPDGKIRYVQQQAKPVSDDKGIFRQLIGTVQDITERKLAESIESDRNRVLEMIIRNERLKDILEHLIRIIETQNANTLCFFTFLRDKQLFLQACSDSLPDFLQETDGQAVGSGSGSCAAMAAYTGHLIAVDDITQSSLWEGRRERALEHGIRACCSLPFISGKGQILGTVSVFYREVRKADETHFSFLDAISKLAAIAVEKSRLSEQLEHQSRHDVLTGLPNRAALTEYLDIAIARLSGSGEKIAVFFIDLDRFKYINDSLGHLIGDRILLDVTRRLRECLGEKGMLGRTGGDEFMYITGSFRDGEKIAALAARVPAIFSLPFSHKERQLYVSASMGISICPDDGTDAVTLQKNADTAMFYAKNEGGNRFRFFSAEMNAAAIERLEIENELRKSVDAGNFELHYQPKYDLEFDVLHGFEALLRWNHPVLGRVPPFKFIPIAEESELIIPIGTWVLQEACRQNAEWEKNGYGKLKIAVNVSMVQFFQEDFVEIVKNALQMHNLPPHRLELELTESIVTKDMKFLIRRLAEFQALGVITSIDDFGTGYSSMSYLDQLPIHYLKIDQSFVRKLGADEETDIRTRTMIRSMIKLGHDLHLAVVAEGIESPHHLDYLRGLGCDIGQGYFFSVPLPAKEVEEKILHKAVQEELL
ncbi:MAG: EAL domain-containing protein [Desulfococcaceae bacterium]